ncbi:hypothetical protein EDO6_02871 [Paenibacillus xylanexedens]|nr:hypothetical protein EDO6_02871 [Paenibacillus xylanexedens]
MKAMAISKSGSAASTDVAMLRVIRYDETGQKGICIHFNSDATHMREIIK